MDILDLIKEFSSPAVVAAVVAYVTLKATARKKNAEADHTIIQNHKELDDRYQDLMQQQKDFYKEKEGTLENRVKKLEDNQVKLTSKVKSLEQNNEQKTNIIRKAFQCPHATNPNDCPVAVAQFESENK